MLLVCGFKSFILMDLDSKDFIQVASSCRGLSNIRTLLFKWFQYYPREWCEEILETRVRTYIVDVPEFDGTNANYKNSQDYYNSYITSKYGLLGYEYYDKTEVL